MIKVTIIKNYRNTLTLRQVDLSEAVQMIQEQAYEELCHQLRHVYPLVEVRQMYDEMDGLFHLYTKDIPKVCFTISDGEPQQAAHHTSLQRTSAVGG